MEVSVPSGSVCCFCLTTYEDEALYGKFYKIEEITTHYFCLLLSSKVQQRGSDNEGILGFLPLDIRNEVKRGKKMTCIYCGKRGATLSCHYSKCRSHFHLPCGRSRDTFHEFFGEFKSFCCRHRKTQRIKGDVLKAMSGKQSTCSICLESVPATPSPSTLWAPCCSKDAWFHRICIQRLALSAGYFFKCPLCNNTTRFIESMRTHGIWIPEQDAAWERDPERYEGLLQRHNSCDAKSCRCKNGRTHHVADTKWEIKLCAHCGSQGMHVQCGNLRLSQDWICSVCSNVSDTKGVQKTGKISHSREAHLARNRNRNSLPLRPPQRVTRQRRPAEEEIEEREEERGKEPRSVHSKSEISASKTDKGASSTPQTDDSSRVTSQSTEVSPAGRPPSLEEENSDVEILENSDDEIQILSTPNIRIIKTNSGISVPVMKVHATQPSGEDVVAAGEPCQSTSGPDQCASMDTGDDFELINVPSTSRIQNPSLQTIGEIIVDDEPLQSSQSEDDDIIVEYEQTNSVPVICQTRSLSSRNTSSSEIYTTAEASLQTNMPTKDTAQSKLDNTKEQNLNVTVPFENIPSARPELSDDKGPPTASETDVSAMTVCPTTHEQSSQTFVPRSEEFVETTDLTNMFYDLSKAVHSASMEQQQQQQAAISSLQPEMFMPTANVFQSVSPLAPNRTTSTSTNSDSTAPGLSVSMQVDPATDMSAWRSKILNLVRGYPIDTQFTTSSTTAPNVSGMPDEMPTQVPLVSEGISMQSSDIPPPNSFSSLTSCYSRPHGTDYSSQQQVSKSQAESSRMPSRQVVISLPNQPPQDDWSVEFGHVDANFIKAQQSIPEEQPDVVFERHPGSVPRGCIPWENSEESTDSDEIIVVDDDQDYDMGSKGGKTKDSKRKRKQKLVERCDYSQERKRKQKLVERCDYSQDRGATKNGPLLCNCKWSRSSQPPSPVICSYCCDWAREYLHIGKPSSATSIKTPQNLLSRFLQSLTGMPGPSLSKGEPLCQLWVIHYHSRKGSRASEPRNSNRASRSRSSNRASRSRSPNRTSRSRSANRATCSKSSKFASQSSSNQVSDTSVSKVLSTLFEKPRTRSQSRSSSCHKPVSDYSKSPQISSQDRLSTGEVSSDKQSSDCESRFHYELKTRRHTYRNQKDSKEKRKRSTSPGTSNKKRREKSLQSSQISPSRKSPRKRTLSQSADSASDNKGKLLAQNAQIFPSLALAKLASFQPVVLLTRYNVRRRELSVERDNHRRSCQTGRSRRDQFTLQKQLQLEANDNAQKLWKDENVSCQTRNDERKRTRSICRTFKNFRERSPVRTRSRSCSLGEDIQRSSHSRENGNGSNSKKKRTAKELIVIPGGSPFASSYETVSSSDETDVEIEVGEDALNETLASISEYCKIDSEGSDEIEDVVEVGEDSLNDTIASISGLGSITYDEDCSSYVIAPSSSCSGNFNNISSNCEDNCSIISISTSVKSSSSSSSSSLVTNSPPQSCISPQPPPTPSPQLPSTPSPQCSPSSSPPSYLTSSCVSPLSMFASPAIFSSSTEEPHDTSGSVNKPSEYTHQLPKHVSNVSSPLVRSPLSCSFIAESTESPSPAINVPLRRSSRRFCSPHDSILPSTSRASRRMHSDVCSEMPIRGSSPPPIFPNRSGSLTELECRIKARALTARKFVPLSPAARRQRAIMRQLQGRR